MDETNTTATEDAPKVPVNEVGDDAVPSAGGRIFRFVAGFVVLVMLMLVGYRYAMNSHANVWYLFQVAKHTAFVLDIVGEEASVEPFRQNGAAAKRRQIAEWAAIDRGDTSLAMTQPDDRPLTAYESWQYEAEARIRAGSSIQDHGPIVRVILEEGLGTKQAELRSELQRLRSGRIEDPDANAARIAELENEIAGLQSQLQAITDPAERTKVTRGYQFTFRVVPDCGAIPSMSIFLAAVLAFPTLWSSRLIGAAGGLALLYGINILRLATLGYIGAIDRTPGQKWFNFIHEYVWQGIFIVFVVAVWMLWIEVVVKARRA